MLVRPSFIAYADNGFFTGDDLMRRISLTIIIAAILLSACGSGGGGTDSIGTVATPTFDPSEGVYDSIQSVTLSTETSGASIFYTTDNSMPTASANLYTTPITVSETDTIKAIAVKSGMADSAVVTATYIINLSVENPVFSLAEGEYSGTQSVALSTATSGASIFYTTDNSIPTLSANLYTAPITVSETTTIKAIAFKSGMADSSVIVATYTIKLTVATPSFYLAPGRYDRPMSVPLFTPTSGAAIYYTTDNSTPTSDSNLYTDPITVNETTTIKAIAIKSGMTDSATASATYRIIPVTFNPGAGTYNRVQNVTLTTGISGATIYYTINNLTPTQADNIYTGPITVKESTTIKAILVKGGVVDPIMASATYTLANVPVVAPPRLSPQGGAYLSNQKIIIFSDTIDAVVHYTTDNSTPTPDDAIYSEPIEVNALTTIKAIAYKKGLLETVVTETYDIIKPNPGVFPDTNQVKCYQPIYPMNGGPGDYDYNPIDCAGTGQDGEFIINFPSYTDNGDGTVSDNLTGLMWAVNANTGDWAESQDYCSSLFLAGHTDWRLPTIRELMSILDYYDGAAPGFYDNGVYYWSSNICIYDFNDAWFLRAGSYTSHSERGMGLGARCVRVAQ